jgi:acyl dehydratase
MAIGRFPVESGQVLAFAQAIGDQNPVYRDTAAAKAVGLAQIAAPPTFVQASAHFDPDYPLRPNPGVEWFGSGAGPGTLDERGAGVLHGEQHYEYHRPLVVGDVLTATVTPGRTWEKEGRRGGKLVFFEAVTVFSDQAGQPVVTTRGVAVRTEKRPEES